jgi:hypothetical protein
VTVDPFTPDFSRAASSGIAAAVDARVNDDNVANIYRAAVETVLREVASQWRNTIGWRGRFVVEDGGSGRPASMLAWFHVSYQKWWFWPGEYLGMICFGPAPPPLLMGRIGSYEFKSLEEFPVAIERFFASPLVGEKLVKLFGSNLSRGSR